MAEPTTLTELPPQGQILLRLDAEARVRAETLLGVDIPATPLRAGSADGADCLWLGPDEWLLLVPETMLADCLTALADALAGTHHALVDVSQRSLILEITGPGARDLLATGCPLDVHDRSFPPGSVTRTLLGKAAVILHRVDAERFQLHVERSFVPYVRDFLTVV